jgi:hypothetical protein
MTTEPAAPAATIPRAPQDSDRSYAALCRYATMGERRNLRALAQELGKSATLVSRWSAQHGWMARVRAYDAAVAAQAQQAFADESVMIARQHAQEAAKLREMALYALAACDREHLPAAVALRLWTEAIRIERLSLGLPTDNTAAKLDVTAHADVRHEVETVKRLMTAPDVHAAVAQARRALSRQLQGQHEGDDEHAG